MFKCLRIYWVVFILGSHLQLSAQENFEEQPQLLLDLVKNMREAVDIVEFQTLQPNLNNELSAHLISIEDVAVALTKAKPGFSTALRLNRNDFDIDDLFFNDSTPLYGAIQQVKKIFHGNIRRKLRGKVDTVKFKELVWPLEEIMKQQLQASLEKRLKNLRNYEIKFGPNSAKLNLAEAVVNQILLRKVPGFGMDDNFSPEPLEMILAYSTTYVTSGESAEDNNGLEFLAAAEIGLRYYVFAKGWGKGSALKPNFISAGVLISREKTGLLSNPFDKANGKLRYGGFLSWGAAVKAAYIFTGDDRKFFLNKQVQLIPFFF